MQTELQQLTSMEGKPAIASNVINLSAGILFQEQVNLLSKGLNFMPTSKMDLFQTLKDINRFICLFTDKHFSGDVMVTSDLDVETSPYNNSSQM